MAQSEKKKSGRKNLSPDDKKYRVWLFVEQGKINKLGGEEAVKNLCYSAIENKINEKSEPDPTE